MKSDIITWIAGLAEESEELKQLEAIKEGLDSDNPDNEPLLSLKELSSILGFKHYTALSRLGIQCVGESYAGGRLRYRRSRAEEYLKSPECMAVREKLRRTRREREAKQ